jgi:hypothetical protein
MTVRLLLDCFVAVAPRNDETLLNRMATWSDKSIVSRFHAYGEHCVSLGGFGGFFDLNNGARSRLGFWRRARDFERFDVCLV